MICSISCCRIETSLELSIRISDVLMGSPAQILCATVLYKLKMFLGVRRSISPPLTWPAGAGPPLPSGQEVAKCGPMTVSKLSRATSDLSSQHHIVPPLRRHDDGSATRQQMAAR